MIDKRIEEIGHEDLLRLQANGVSESRSLDYKQVLPGGNDEERREFLADVSSFANSGGGDLVYGIVEARPTAVPERIDGIAGATPDADTLRRENMLRDGIAPRLPGIQWRWVSGFPQGPVLIIRVPRSWAGPHMVTFKQHSRFYARNAGGKFALDVFELRRAFLDSGSLRERAREFRAERLGRLLAGDTPIQLLSDALVCVHVVPHVSLAGALDIDLGRAGQQHDFLSPLSTSSWTSNFNIDGLVTFRPTSDGPSIAYLQIHRSGALETASSIMFGHRGHNNVPLLPAGAFADQLSAFVTRASRLMMALNVEPPASMFLSILGARGVLLGLSERLTFYSDIHAVPYDRDQLLFRDLLITEWDGAGTFAKLKPVLDEVWQAAGLARCLYYDDQGNWKPR